MSRRYRENIRESLRIKQNRETKPQETVDEGAHSLREHTTTRGTDSSSSLARPSRSAVNTGSKRRRIRSPNHSSDDDGGQSSSATGSQSINMDSSGEDEIEEVLNRVRQYEEDEAYARQLQTEIDTEQNIPLSGTSVVEATSSRTLRSRNRDTTESRRSRTTRNSRRNTGRVETVGNIPQTINIRTMESDFGQTLATIFPNSNAATSSSASLLTIQINNNANGNDDWTDDDVDDQDYSDVLDLEYFDDDYFDDEDFDDDEFDDDYDDEEADPYLEWIQELTGQVYEPQTQTLSKDEISRLPVIRYDPDSKSIAGSSKGKLSSSSKGDTTSKMVTESQKVACKQTECHICLVHYKNRDKLRMLPCMHSYHAKCIDQWLVKNATCPICRKQVQV